MAGTKKATHVIAQRNVVMMVGKEMQEMPVGTPLVLSEEQAKKMRSKVSPIHKGETVDLTKSKGESSE